MKRCHDSRKVCRWGWATWTGSVDEIGRNSCKKPGFIVKLFSDQFGVLLLAFVSDFRLSSV